MKKIPLTSVVVATALSIPTVCAAADSNDMANTKSSTPPSEVSTTISKSESGPSKKAESKKSKSLDKKKYENNEKHNKQKDNKDASHLKSQDKKEKDVSDTGEYIHSKKRRDWDEKDKNGMYLSMNFGAISIPTHPTLNIYEILTQNLSALTTAPNQSITVTGSATFPPKTLLLNEVEITNVDITSNKVQTDLPGVSGTSTLDSFGLTGADVSGTGTGSIAIPDKVINNLGYVTVDNSKISSDEVIADLPAKPQAVLNNISAFGINLNGGTGNASIPEAPISFSGLDSKGATIKTSTPGSIGLGAQEGSLTSLNINKANLKDGTLIADLPANNAKLTNFIAQGVKIEGGTSQGDVTIPKATSAQFQNLTTKNASIRTNYQGTNTIGLGTQTGTIDSLEINEAKLVSTEGLVSTNTYKVGFSSLSSSDTDLKAGATGKTLATVTIPEKKKIKIKDISIYDSTIEARDSRSSIHLAQQTASFQGPITLRDADIKEGAVTTTIPGHSMNLRGVSGTLNLSNGSGQESISGNVNVPGQSLSIPRQNGTITSIELTKADLNNGSLTANLPSNKVALTDISGKATIDAGKELVGSGTSIISEVETDVSITVPKQNVNLNSLKIKDAKLTSDSIKANIPARETTLDTIIFEEVIVKAKNDNNSIILTDSSITGGTVTSDLPSNTISLSGLSGFADIKTEAIGATSSADVTISKQTIKFPELTGGEATNIALNNVLLTSEEYGLDSPTFFAQLPAHSASISDISGTVTLTSGVGASSSANINIPSYFGQATNLTFTGASLNSNSITADLPEHVAIIEDFNINNANISSNEVAGSLNLSSASVSGGTVTTNLPGQTAASLANFGITDATASGTPSGSLSLRSTSITGNTKINIPAQIKAALGGISGTVSLSNGSGTSSANVRVGIGLELTGQASELRFVNGSITEGSLIANLPATSTNITDFNINTATASGTVSGGSLNLGSASVSGGTVIADLPGQTGANLAGFSIAGATASGTVGNNSELTLNDADIEGKATGTIRGQSSAALKNITGTINLANGTGTSSANFTIPERNVTANNLSFTDASFEGKDFTVEMPIQEALLTVRGPVNLGIIKGAGAVLPNGDLIPDSSSSGDVNIPSQDITFPALKASARNLKFTGASLSNMSINDITIPGQTTQNLSGFGVTGATITGTSNEFVTLRDFSFEGGVPTIGIPEHTSAALSSVSGTATLDATVEGSSLTGDLSVPQRMLSAQKQSGKITSLKLTDADLKSDSLTATIPANPGAKLTTVSGTVDLKTGAESSITGNVVVPSQSIAVAEQTGTIQSLTLRDAKLTDSSLNIDIPDATTTLKDFEITGATMGGKADKIESTIPAGMVKVFAFSTEKAKIEGEKGQISLPKQEGVASDLYFKNSDLVARNGDIQLYSTKNIPIIDIDVSRATITGKPKGSTITQANPGIAVTNLNISNAEAVATLGTIDLPEQTGNAKNISFNSTRIDATDTRADISGQNQVTLANYQVFDASLKGTPTDSTVKLPANDSLTLTKLSATNTEITASGNIRLSEQSGIVNNVAFNNASINPGDDKATFIADLPEQRSAVLSNVKIDCATVSGSATTDGTTIPGDTITNLGEVRLSQANISSTPATTVTGRGTVVVPAQSKVPLSNFKIDKGTVIAETASIRVPEYTALLNGDANIRLGDNLRAPSIAPGSTFDAPENPTYTTDLSKSDYIVPIADLNLGFYLSKNFRTEIGLSHLFKKNSVYTNTELYKNPNTALPNNNENAAGKDGINVTRTINSKMNFFSVNAVGYYDFHNSSNLTPFIGLGFGYGFSRYSMDGATITKTPVTQAQISTEALQTDKTSTRANFSSKTSGNMNFSAHIGASYKLTHNVTLQGKLFLQSMGQFITTEPDVIHIQQSIKGALGDSPDTVIATQALQLKNKNVLSYGATAGIRISF